MAVLLLLLSVNNMNNITLTTGGQLTLLLALLLLLAPLHLSTACVCGKAKRNHFAFPGDKSNDAVNNFPWMVSVISVSQFDDNYFKSLLCVGSLINDRDILTSATCVHLFQPHELLISVSSSQSENSTAWRERGGKVSPHQLSVDSIKIHPAFVKSFATSGRVLKNDIAILRVTTPIDVENDEVTPSPVCLHEMKSPSSVKQMILSGWQYPAPGSSSLGKAQTDSMTYLDLIPPEECKSYFSRIVDLDASTTACTPTPTSVCYLERGSPLLFEYSSFIYQYALVSLSRQIADCSIRKNKVPTVLVTIHPYLNWIKEVTNGAHWCWAPFQAFS